MRILSLGWVFALDGVTDERFRSSTSALDYDLVFWNPNLVTEEYPAHQQHQGKPSLSEHESAQAAADVSRRRQEFVEILKLGRSLVVVTAPPQVCYVDTGRREFSGTGRNRVTTRIVTPLDFLSAIPADVSTMDATGTQLGLVGAAPLDDFWRANKDFFSYSAYFDDPPGSPWVAVEGTDRIVATHLRTDSGGHLLFIPALIDAEDPNDPTLLEREERFIDSLRDLVGALETESGEFTLPGWTDSFRSVVESAALKDLSNAQASLSRAEKEMSNAQVRVEEASRPKLLISGSGRALEVEVAEVFRVLGCVVREGDPGRDDLIVENGDHVLVVEAKGVSGSAAEKHVAQLEKWASIYFETEGRQPKPILVVNAFRDQPLHQRPAEVFPDQLISYATARGHCLVSGIQMLGIRLAVENNSALADEIFESLVACIGRYERFADWSEFLDRESEEVAPTGESLEVEEFAVPSPVGLKEASLEEE